MRLGKIRKIHFVGIGGIGMSGIAEVLLNLGYAVTGSDLNPSEITERLAELGARIYADHRPEHVHGSDVVIYSSAVTLDNPEVQEALRLKIPVIKRAEMLGELMRLKFGIAIAGTHGKTTTTSLTGAVLSHAGLDPTLIIGGRVRAMNTNAQLGSGDLLVAEADEFDRSLLNIVPTIAVITNIEADHMECYADLEDLHNAFVTFANKVPFYGRVIACLDDPGVQEVLQRIKRRLETYGFSPQADWVARDVTLGPEGSRFTVVYHGEKLGEVTLRLPGKHNVLNALAALAVGNELEVPFATMQEALAGFSGVDRRFDIKGEFNGVMVVDDYAHHPTEIEATLKAARTGWPERRLVVAFQPHLYSRTQYFLNAFARALMLADVVLVLDVYPAREAPIPGVSGQALAEAARALGHRQVYFLADKTQLPEKALEMTRPGDMLLTIGAGDIWRLNRNIVARFRQLAGEQSAPKD
ncbi:MAG: UDP-N-acetylmuramate--L-alanine ligase [Calditrichaeota bacterium]|nr:MAG: UDP-N-acetylmuramate--L-alanine ligase [Calditrichota bacterium]